MNQDFALCDMADDLLLLTLDMCDRDSRRPRTPKRLHRSLADRIVLAACTIQEAVILANETGLQTGRESRAGHQAAAMRYCIVLKHQARILHERGYISDKQCERWQKLCVNVYWKIYAWAKSDSKR